MPVFTVSNTRSIGLPMRRVRLINSKMMIAEG